MQEHLHTARAATPTPVAVASPVPLESNPPGDVPDSQQFVEYRSAAGGYSLRVPEGWARTEQGTSVAFVNNLDSIRVDLLRSSAPPSLASVRANDEPALRAQNRAFEEVLLAAARLPGGPAVLLRYQINSDPDPVTGRRIRLQVDRYSIYSSGRVAILSLSAPAGSDNVDVWHAIATSFRWV